MSIDIDRLEGGMYPTTPDQLRTTFIATPHERNLGTIGLAGAFGMETFELEEEEAYICEADREGAIASIDSRAIYGDAIDETDVFGHGMHYEGSWHIAHTLSNTGRNLPSGPVEL